MQLTRSDPNSSSSNSATTSAAAAGVHATGFCSNSPRQLSFKPDLALMQDLHDIQVKRCQRLALMSLPVPSAQDTAAAVAAGVIRAEGNVLATPNAAGEAASSHSGEICIYCRTECVTQCVIECAQYSVRCALMCDSSTSAHTFHLPCHPKLLPRQPFALIHSKQRLYCLFAATASAAAAAAGALIGCAVGGVRLLGIPDPSCGRVPEGCVAVSPGLVPPTGQALIYR